MWITTGIFYQISFSSLMVPAILLAVCVFQFFFFYLSCIIVLYCVVLLYAKRVCVEHATSRNVLSVFYFDQQK